jgi:hypothetical protein
VWAGVTSGVGNTDAGVTCDVGSTHMGVTSGVGRNHTGVRVASRNERGRFGALKSDSTHHFFRNACTKSGLLRFS